MAFSVVFGAGKIARGFIAHLLSLSHEDFVFVEKVRELADLINARKQYGINVLGAAEKNMLISDVRALSYADADEISSAIAKASILFTAVGGKNLAEIVPFLVKGLTARFEVGNDETVNIITCENWNQPAALLRKEIMLSLNSRYHDRFDALVGIAEAVVMRSAIEAGCEALKADPLTVNVQDYWVLPVDASGIRGKLPEIKGIMPIEAFEGFLERKFYTYNAANGTVSYLGYLRGHSLISDAAADLEILEILSGVYLETGAALAKKFNLKLEDQLTFGKTSLAKLQDRTIVDSIERNARDPIRKLSPQDRLIGPARLVLEHGGLPVCLSLAIAAAIHYDEPSDQVALELRKMREEEGIDSILVSVCGIEADGELAALIRQGIVQLKNRGWIKEGS
jgi:mannitol-1-phosphate 5-dehydrogenase